MFKAEPLADADTPREYILEIEQELRFEVEENAEVTLELLNGFAEIFGSEISHNRKYTFHSFSNIAVFTWHGCTIRLTGKTTQVYISKDTPMIIYVNVHAAIENLRCRAEDNNSRGPSILITGPTDVGKSTLCRILLNYAARLGRKPIFIDLDVGQGQISLPATVSALLIEKSIDIEEGLASQTPLVYHFGHKSPGNNISLYNKLISKLADLTLARAENNHRTLISGFIINTCGWVKSHGYRAITHAALAFEVDAIIVIDHKRLYYELVRDMPKFVNIVYIPKSGGVVERSTPVRAKSRESRVFEYFYGAKLQLTPYTFDVNFSDIKIYRIGPMERTYDDELRLKPFPVDFGLHLMNRILSVSFTDNVEEVVNTNIAGFICVVNVYFERGIITVLSPEPAPLPNAILLISDVVFTDFR